MVHIVRLKKKFVGFIFNYCLNNTFRNGVYNSNETIPTEFLYATEKERFDVF